MQLLRRLLLLLIVLIPLVTLAHRDDRGRWDLQHSAMAGPDEFSYLLMADHFLHGGGLSLKDSIGRDTFYPPGFPLLLAGWAKIVGLTAFTAHAFNALVLCLDTLLVYFFTQRIFRMLLSAGHRRFLIADTTQSWLALLIAALFATNWHVLECSLLVMSEPSFMLATFAWLMVALSWTDWTRSLPKTILVALLAIVAWSIRGAGIACVATTLTYALASFIAQMRSRSHIAKNRWPWRKLATIALIVLMAAAYQATLMSLSPEKSVTSGEESANSYPRQLLHGLRDNNLAILLLGHLDDYASTFVPWPRENPDMHFRDAIGKFFGLLGLLGWLWHVIRRGKKSDGARRFLELFIGLYFTLYLIWPFHFARFWSPIMPLMLVYAADALIRFPECRRWMPACALPACMFSLLLLLSGEELFFKLNDYARRLNYVSDALAQSARTILRHAPHPQLTTVLVMNGDDHFALAWYLSQEFHDKTSRISHKQNAYLPQSPQTHVSARQGKGESPEEMLVRNLRGELFSDTPRVVYFFSYFAHVDAADVMSNARRLDPQVMNRTVIQKIYQKEIVAALWELRVRPLTATYTQP